MNYFVTIFCCLLCGFQSFAQQGKISPGDDYIDFSLKTEKGEKVSLSELNKENQVVLVVLRGWPGYQCPICTRQVGGLIEAADEFAKNNAQVLMVYPGPSENLVEYSREFSDSFDFPDNFHFALDPDYSMINKYGLRWDAPNETAYPSTFVINENGKVVFAKVSDSHGGRAEVEEIMEVLERKK